MGAYVPGFGISGGVRQILFELLVARDIETPLVYERTNLTM